MKRDNLSSSSIQPQQDMDALIQALETPPVVPVPAGFAARVMRQLPVQRRRRSFAHARAIPPRFGITAAVLALLGFVVALLCIPVRGGDSVLQTGTQLLLGVQFLAVALWLSLLRWRYR